ncbi:hypothetical protein [Streptomyces sp. NPDC048272]|uniref:hypothetical protein n=1 Tax=Streptomyces sp. NPDC048272 TaxID=3154616 RepID=UPI003419B686
MPKLKETNVRLPVCAHQALAVIAVRQGTSRDETVRRLLTDHVEAQEAEDPDDRLTHISTVLRYPPAPRFRNERRQDKPLRLRTEPDLLQRARAVSLRLPGQYERAHRDYQGRMLTDAVITAIARVQPFTDAFLDGLLPMLRHRAALALWRLATKGTSTRPEKDLLTAAAAIRTTAWQSRDSLSSEQKRVLLVAEALEEEVSWHSPARFKEAARLARHLLSGPDAALNDTVLHEQRMVYDRWYTDALHDSDRPPLANEGRAYDWSGRGGAAVWRAQRRVEFQGFEEWLLERGGEEHVMAYPGWLLRVPSGWHAYAPARSHGRPPQPYAAWAAAGRVLAFPYRDREAFWPLRLPQGWSGWTPVPGIGAITAAAKDVRPDRISHFIEALLIQWNRHLEDDRERVGFVLEFPADKARDFGFITETQLREARVEARSATLRSMNYVIDELGDEYSETDLAPLRKARGQVRAFAHLARQYDKRIGSRFQHARPHWRWPGSSVLDTLLDGSDPRLVEFLAGWAHKMASRSLELSMQQAWDRAFDLYARRM